MKQKEVFLRCIAPGRWSTCSACAEAHSAAQLISRDALQQKLCANCGEEKLNTYFAEGCTWCSPCELRKSFCRQECGSCRKWKYTHAFTAGDDEMAESLPICSACSPQHQKYTCTVCDKIKERRQFDARALHRQKRSSIVRCKACFTCNICHEQKSGGRCFETATRHCWVCRPSRMFRCDVCGDSKGEAHFAPNVLENAQRHSRKRVCMLCSEKGYSARDTKTYHCRRGCQWGHLKFGRCNLCNHKAKNRCDTLLCLRCRETEVACDACGELKGEQDFNLRIMTNSRCSGRLCICRSCEDSKSVPSSR